MAVSFQDNEIQVAWSDVFSKDAYRIMISDIADNYPQKKSVRVDYGDINTYNVDFAMYVLDNPDRCMEIARKTVMSLVPNINRPGDAINVRVYNLPRDAKVEIRNLRADHLGKLIAVEGLARKVTTVKPRMTHALFRCSRCGSEIWMEEPGTILREPVMCSGADGSCNKQNLRFILDMKSSVFMDTQKIEIQESPEGLRGGAQPERISGYVEDDIAGEVTAGNRITLNGVLRSVEKGERDKSTVFETFLDVTSVEFEQHEYDEILITEEDEERIREMSRDPQLFDNIVRSISPSIYGLDEVKRAIALQLFGGCHKEMDDGTVMRGDMHILLMGDPGVAKSQLLRYMSMLAPRGIYASGKSASAAGLTAAAVRDDFGDGRWTLEAGALVLADKGLACIDELDKMTDQDRSSLHEAMESQKISVAKAGITATLQCRCSMLAAANPKYGRFEEDAAIADQIDLPPALMSRFDMIFVLTDKPDKKKDTAITEHILMAHQRGQARMVPDSVEIKGVDVKGIMERTSNIKPVYDVDILRKYVAYSKRLTPIMTDEAKGIIQDSFLRIRLMGNGGNSVPITARQLEAFVRLSEASARMRLSDKVTDVDANRAVDLVEYYLRRIAGNDDGGFDIDKIASGISSKDRNRIDVVRDLMREYGDEGLTMDELIQHGSNQGLAETDVTRAVKNLSDGGEIYRTPAGVYKRT
ncbi:MAG: minichromosome maintenance protein MCM [Candidatus Methanomethylophilaceae archaeon]|nr:minichromosome maintenance protein MCM [Candidatus Methanomethylophilaceae archaeon]